MKDPVERREHRVHRPDAVLVENTKRDELRVGRHSLEGAAVGGDQSGHEGPVSGGIEKGGAVADEVHPREDRTFEVGMLCDAGVHQDDGDAKTCGLAPGLIRVAAGTPGWAYVLPLSAISSLGVRRVRGTPLRASRSGVRGWSRRKRGR